MKSALHLFALFLSDSLDHSQMGSHRPELSDDVLPFDGVSRDSAIHCLTMLREEREPD